jgi:hypothetical protein
LFPMQVKRSVIGATTQKEADDLSTTQGLAHLL